MLHVMVEAVDAWDSTNLGVRESSRLSSTGTKFRASSSLMDTRGVIGDRGVWNVFLACGGGGGTIS